MAVAIHLLKPMRLNLAYIHCCLRMLPSRRHCRGQWWSRESRDRHIREYHSCALAFSAVKAKVICARACVHVCCVCACRVFHKKIFSCNVASCFRSNAYVSYVFSPLCLSLRLFVFPSPPSCCVSLSFSFSLFFSLS